MSRVRAAISTVRARGVFDLLWIGGFALCLTLLLMRPSISAVAGKGVALELTTGGQRRGIYHGDTRIGALVEHVKRHGKGWLLTQELFVAPAGKKPIGTISLQLYRDLSLERVDIDADLGELPLLGGGAAAGGGARGAALARVLPLLRRVLGHSGRIRIGGACETHRGSCWLRGRLGDRPFGREVNVGRGPVLTNAIFPLLARGTLGRRAELQIFDPLGLSTRLVTFRVGEREPLTLHSGAARGLRVEQDAGLMRSTVWLDSRGRVLLEKMAGGLRIEHEAWVR